MSASDERLGPGRVREPPDLRLLPFVAGVWTSEWAVMLGQPTAPIPWAVGGVVLVGAALVGGRLVAPRGRNAGGPTSAPVLLRGSWIVAHRSWALLAVLVLTGSGLGCAVASLQVARLHPTPLAQAIGRASVVEATVRVRGDPVLSTPADDGGRRSAASWSVPASVREVRVGGRTQHIRLPVLLRGDAARDLEYGEVVRIRGRAQASWAPASYSMTVRLLGEAQVRSPPGVVARTTSRIRAAFRAACAGIPADSAGLLLGLAVGDESLVSPDLDKAMVRSGLAHLTAVSGSNTTLVVAIAMGAVGIVGLGWRLRVSVGILVLAGYVALVRPQPSVMRAAAMGLVALLALGAGGRRRGPPALLAASLLLLLALPQYAVSIGFALSVSATAGLLMGGPAISGRLAQWRVTGWVPDPVREALAVAAAAHVATLPLAVLMGNGASLVALPANVVVTPLVPVATVLGLAAALLAPLAPTVSAGVAHAAAPFTGLVAIVAREAADVRYGVVDVPKGPLGALASAALLAVVAMAVHRRWRPWRFPAVRMATLLVVAISIILGHARDERWPPPGWVVLACDVGQGDSIVLRRPGSRQALLVDAGPAGGRIVDCLRDAGVERLVVLLSHFHADHVDGLTELLDRCPVEAVLTSWVAEPPDQAARVLGAAVAAGVPVRSVRAGDTFTVAGVSVSVLWPARALAESPANNGSVVALAEIPAQSARVRVLLPGDVEPEAQSAVAARGVGSVDVVKVPHHGSRYNSSSFAAWAGARFALITVGRDNEFGHPSRETIAKYESAGSLVARTDTDGALAVVAAPGGLTLKRQR